MELIFKMSVFAAGWFLFYIAVLKVLAIPSRSLGFDFGKTLQQDLVEAKSRIRLDGGCGLFAFGAGLVFLSTRQMARENHLDHEVQAFPGSRSPGPEQVLPPVIDLVRQHFRDKRTVLLLDSGLIGWLSIAWGRWGFSSGLSSSS